MLQSSSAGIGGSWHCFGTPTAGQKAAAWGRCTLQEASCGGVPAGISKHTPKPRPGGQVQVHEPPPLPPPPLMLLLFLASSAAAAVTAAAAMVAVAAVPTAGAEALAA